MLVELKSGETYNGRLVNCDAWMNINLRHVICTSKDGEKFFKMSECYIRGSSIKYFRLPDGVMDAAEKLEQKERMDRSMNLNPSGRTHKQPFSRGGGGRARGGSGRGGPGRHSATGRTAGGRGERVHHQQQHRGRAEQGGAGAV
jgi:U6 snRNA-associated Sm-like protein LSm4